MCGRYAYKYNLVELSDSIQFESSIEAIHPNFNVFPTALAPVLRLNDSTIELQYLSWGLIPPFSKSLEDAYRLSNARIETADSKPSFKRAFQSMRCIVPISGFYEWKKEGKSKQPFYIYGKEDILFLGGLWEHFPNEREDFLSFTILTQAANASVSSIHERMPVIIEKSDAENWLSLSSDSLGDILEKSREYPLSHHAISTYVNSPKNNSEECILPL